MRHYFIGVPVRRECCQSSWLVELPILQAATPVTASKRVPECRDGRELSNDQILLNLWLFQIHESHGLACVCIAYSAPGPNAKA